MIRVRSKETLAFAEGGLHRLPHGVNSIDALLTSPNLVCYNEENVFLFLEIASKAFQLPPLSELIRMYWRPELVHPAVLARILELNKLGVDTDPKV